MKIPVKIDGLSQKKDLEACWLDEGGGEMVAHREIREVIKIKNVHPKFFQYSLKGCK